MNLVVNEIVDSFNEYLTKVESGLDILIQNLSNYEFSKNINDLLNLIEGLTWLIEVNDKLTPFAKVNNIDIAEFNRLNNELISIIDQQDSYMCIDLLEYEYKQFLIKIREIKEVI